ncbi:MAG: GTPase HflX [Spirochaetaceae bacterium]|jgi:GTP-binding protein HflX|nr:GTPase HflX [Spirochaetaceae bacterium]
MFEVEAEMTEPIRALLVGAASRDAMSRDAATRNAASCDAASRDLRELRGLTDTLGFETAGSVLLTKTVPSPQYGIGTGKAAEISDLASRCEADCILFDFEISPTQQRNWEKLTGLPVYDRQEVILRIFSARARTKEAVLQVELAKLSYSLPRLAHTYGDMARQRGGSYGSKGSGETQLELDRRAVMDRIAAIKKELKKVSRERATLRKRRGKVPVPSCALVGYTNAGKSSLLNALTGASVLVEDKLFATLDPTTRRLEFAGGGEILLTDTVGFISSLPHTLVDAFHATLEEAVLADLILLVVDISDPACREQYRTTIEVLEEIGAAENPRIIVLNKIDALDTTVFGSDPPERFPAELVPRAVRVSAKTGEGFDQLIAEITAALLGDEKEYLLPSERSDLAALVRRSGSVLEERWDDNGIYMKARISGRTAALLREFLLS